MNLTNIKKNYIMLLAIAFVVVALSDTTYSLFLKTDSTDNFTYNTGNLALQFTEDEQITLANAFPIIDSEGLKSEAYTLTIKNNGTLPYIFDLKMLADTAENIIDTRYIKYQVNNDKPSTLYASNNIISPNTILAPNEEKEFNIKIWLDISTPNRELGKTFVAKIVTSGEATYKTLDTSGANQPKLTNNMLEVYYDETSNIWKKADKSNKNEDYRWYNYDEQLWANSIILNESQKIIYDITRNNDIKMDEVDFNSNNYITENRPLDVGLKNYSNNTISTILRLKFNNINRDEIYILSNGKLNYYYDTTTEQLVLEIGNNQIKSKFFKISRNVWYTIGLTINNNQASLYINGNNIGTNNITENINTNNSMKIGINYQNQELSNLELGELYIYNDLLTEQEIKENYNSEITIIKDNLVSGYNDFEPKTIQEYYLTKPLGFPINELDINSQYVWIPRYKYKLWNITGENNIDTYNAKSSGIDIIFENQTETSGIIQCQDFTCYGDHSLMNEVTSADNNKYYTPISFQNNDQELTGFWVSKYEISSNNGIIESKKGNTSLTNNTLTEYQETIKSLSNENNYHVIKNTEWGTVTYLSYSKYGLCPNNKCKNIETNNTYISGNNEFDTTTGNITGIYDMSGGASEFVMASTNNLLNNEEYDIYINDNFILGDATKETINWFNNKDTFLTDNSNFLVRGGYTQNTNSNLFTYQEITNNKSTNISTRIVIK